jgi:hypothetical protein
MKPALINTADHDALEVRLTDNVQHERNEPVVGGQREQDTVNEQNVLEVVDDAFAVEKVHGSAEEVPVERFGEAQTAGLAGHIGNCNYLLEGYDLHRRDNDDDVDVAGAEDPEEAENHDERPYRAGYEVGLFLLVLGRGQLWSLRLSAGYLCLAEGFKCTAGAATPFLVGLPGSEAFSLYSDTLMEGRRCLAVLAERCWWLNLTSLRGRVMIATCGSADGSRVCGGDSEWARGGCDQAERGRSAVGEYCRLERRLVEVGQAQCEKRRARDGR